MRIRKKRLGVNYYSGKFDELFINGVYDDGNFNKEGKYGRGIKRYFNKVSGKWVGIKNCYKSEKIWVYEFENLNERLIVTEFKKKDEEDYRSFRFVDKVLLFISYLYKKSLLDRRFREGGGIYISRIELIEYLGINDWKFLCKVLDDSNIVSFIDGGRSSYDFSKKLNLVKINFSVLGKIINRRFIENKLLEKSELKKYKIEGLNIEEIDNVKNVQFNISDKRLSEICEEKFNNKIDENKKELKWGKLFYSDKDLKDKRRFIEENDKERYYSNIVRRYNLFKDLIDEMNKGWIDYSLLKRDEHGGRFYNIINGMDKEFRRELKFDGEELVEIDMSGMYVKCLVYMFERIKFMNGSLYKERSRDKFKRLKKDGNLDFSGKDKRVNKGLNGFEWDDGEILDYEFGLYEGIKMYEGSWKDRKYSYKSKYDINYKSYDLGESKGTSLNKLIDNLGDSNNEFLDVFNEYNNVINEFGDINGEFKFEDDYLKYFNVNSNVINFNRSDNLIKNVRNYFNGKLREEYIKDDINFFNIGSVNYKDKRYNNYEDYINDNNESIKIVDDKFYSEERDLEENDYKIKYKKGDKISYRILKKKFVIKFNNNENYNLFVRNEYEKYEEKKFNKNIKVLGLSNIKYSGNNFSYNDFNNWKLMRFGEVVEYKVKDDIEVDLSLDERIGYDGFINKYKNKVFNNDKVDFYSLVKFMINYNYKKRNDGGVGFEDSKIYDRSFYKVLIMRLLFTQNYLVENMKIGNSKRGVIKEIFGEEGEVFIKMIKNINLDINEFGERKVKIDWKDNYKNISKILSVIETDIMNYLVRRVFKSDGGLLGGEFYVNIFDGFLVKKSNFNRIKLELNMVLKREVGYMFYMK